MLINTPTPIEKPTANPSEEPPDKPTWWDEFSDFSNPVSWRDGVIGAIAAGILGAVAGKIITMVKATLGNRSNPDQSEVSASIIDINLADQETLETLPGIGPELARRIIEYRQQNGRFMTIQDLMKVAGIKASKFGRLKDNIKLGSLESEDVHHQNADSKGVPDAMVKE
jgi:comEA protein